MKKKFLVLLFIIVLLLPCFAYALSYTYSESGISFELPAGWKKTPLSAQRDIIKAKFTLQNDSAAVIVFGAFDMWSAISQSEKKGMQRAEFDLDYLPQEEVKAIFDLIDSDITKEVYGGVEYYKAEFTTSLAINDVSVPLQTTNLITCHNGYMYLFQFMEMDGENLSDDFYNMIRNVNYPSATKTVSGSSLVSMSWLDIIASLIITAGLYTGPIAIYRFWILRESVDKAKAKKITIGYGIVAFILMSIILNRLNGSGTAGYSIVLWSSINYALLTKGRKEEDSTAKDSEDQTAVLPMEHQMETASTNSVVQAQSPAVMEVPEKAIAAKNVDISAPTEICFCYKCGNKLVEGSVFCNKCGTKVM